MLAESVPFKTKLFSGILGFTLAWFLFQLYFEYQVNPVPSEGAPWLTLDPSWQLCMNYANVKALHWGNEFVFTYGPLAFLSTRIAWNVNAYLFLAFDLFLAFNYFIFFYSLAAESKSKAGFAAMALLAAFILPKHLGSGLALILMVLLVFHVRKNIEKFTWLGFALQSIIAVLLFYIKMNTGLFSVLFILIGLLANVFGSNRKSPLMLLLLLVPLSLIGAMAPLLNVNLPAYIYGAFQMVEGYNAIMYLNEPFDDAFHLALFIICGSAILVVYQYFLKHKFTIELFLKSAVFLIPLFILFKQGFTRGDSYHIEEFFVYFIWLILAAGIWETEYNSNVAASYLWIAAFTCLFFTKRKETQLGNVWERWDKNIYKNGFNNHTDSSCLQIFKEPKNILPQHILSKIATGTIDIIPWNAQLLIENKLNYRPRPVFQTYTAFTPYLQNLNCNYFLEGNAPANIIYEFQTIDSRYAGFDEFKLQYLIQKHYACTDTFYFSGRLHLLLQKKSEPVFKKQLIQTIEISLDDTLPALPNQYYEIDAAYTLTGKLASALYHAPEIKMGIILDDGNIFWYRTSFPMLASGFGLNRHFFNTEQYYYYLNPQDIPGGQTITGYKLQATNAWSMPEKIKVNVYAL